MPAELGRPSPPTVEQLRALARKYRTLVEIHRALAAYDDAGARLLDARLAAEFPGALRELQTQPMDELERRAAALEAAAARDGVVVEPWMEWLRAYHALLRAALDHRRRSPRSSALSASAASATIDDAAATRIARALSAESDFPVDEAFARAVLRPPGGRLGDVVLRRLATVFGVDAATIARALFPRQRRQIE